MKTLIPRSEFHGIIDHPGSAAVLGLNEAGEVLLIKTYKEQMPQPLYEIPGGVLEDKETPEQAARRELEEETGYTFNWASHFYTITPSVGYSNEWIAVFQANVSQVNPESEFTPYFFSIEKTRELIDSGQVVDAQSLAALSAWVQDVKTRSLKKPDVLFICTGNYYRSRFCERYFNHLNSDTDLSAESKGLWAYRKINPGFISEHTAKYCHEHRIPLGRTRLPEQLEVRHMENTRRIIALDEVEHHPMMKEMFPKWADKIEYWNVHDIDFTAPDEALDVLRKQTEALSAELNSTVQ